MIFNLFQASKKKSAVSLGVQEEKRVDPRDPRQSVSAKRSGQNILRKAKLQLNRYTAMCTVVHTTVGSSLVLAIHVPSHMPQCRPYWIV